MIYMLIVKTVRIYIYDQIFGYVFKHKKYLPQNQSFMADLFRTNILYLLFYSQT